MAKINNLYWSYGWSDGHSNRHPDLDGELYTAYHLARYFEGYRCGVRAQSPPKQKENDCSDRKQQHL